MPLEYLELPTRLKNSKIPEEMALVGDLLAAPKDLLLERPNIGRKSIEEIGTCVDRLTRLCDVTFDLEHSESDEELLLDYGATLFLAPLDETQITIMCGRSVRGLTLRELALPLGLTRERVRQVAKKGDSDASTPAQEQLAGALLKRIGRAARRAHALDVLAFVPARSFADFRAGISPRVEQFVGVCLHAFGRSFVYGNMGVHVGEWGLLASSAGVLNTIEDAFVDACREQLLSENAPSLAGLIDGMSERLSRCWNPILGGIRARHMVCCLVHQLKLASEDDFWEFALDVVTPTSVDRVSTVMSELGRPVHFKHLTAHVNLKLGASSRMEPGDIYAILARRRDLFARTARGIYALRELGYEDVPGIGDFLRGVLAEEGRPMLLNELVNIGARLHGFRDSSIRMTLYMNPDFMAEGSGFYGLRRGSGSEP